MSTTATLPIELTRPLAFLDTETTGTDPQKDRIVELSLVIYRPGADEPEVRTRRLNPEVPIPAEATAVHGITDADVAGEPTFRQVAENLLLLLDGCDFAGFNVRRFDVPILCAEFGLLGMKLDLEGRRMLDAQFLFHLHERRDLESAVVFYLGRCHDGAHGAEADARAAAEVLFAQVDRYELPRDVGELDATCDEFAPFETEADRWWDRSSDDPKEWVFRRGKHKGEKLGSGVVRPYLDWMAHKADDMHDEVRQIARDMLFGRFG